jgi:hypothetical protein
MQALRNLLERLFPPRRKPNRPQVDFSYTVYWTKQARGWDEARRAAVRAALRNVMSQPGFEANTYQRRYRVEGLDDVAHAGASLMALKKVLNALADE